MKVWVVTAGPDYEQAHYMAVFSEKVDAENDAKRLKGTPACDWVDVDEMDVK